MPEKIADTVVARFRGRGTGHIPLLAHMDTGSVNELKPYRDARCEGGSAVAISRRL